MSKLSISKAWEEAKHVLAHDGKLITSVALALIVRRFCMTTRPVNPPSWMPVVAILVAILGITGQVAVTRLALGPSTSVGESIQHGFRRVVPAFLALLVLFFALVVVLLPIMIAMAGPEGLKSVATETPTPAAGGALLIVVFLCLLAAPRFQLVVPTAAAEEGGPIRLLQRSWRMTEGSYLKLLGFLALVLIAAVVVLFTGQIIVGLVAKAMFGTVHPYSLGALLAGLLTAMISAAFAAVSTVILARIYVQLSGRSDVGEVFR